MPLSNIFSASTSNAIYETKIVIENNSAIQPIKDVFDLRIATTYFIQKVHHKVIAS